MPAHRPIEDRFFEKFEKKASGCWEWTAVRNEKGYGKIGDQGRGLRAHRVSWTIHFGPIPRGKFVCHKCDNPSCVNPGHLFLGSPKLNTADMVAKGRAAGPRGEKQRSVKLTRHQVLEIRRRYSKHERNGRMLASEFDVGTDQISRIVNRKVWAWLDGEE